MMSEMRKFPIHTGSSGYTSFLGPESLNEKQCILSKNDKYKKFSFLLELFKNFKKGYKKGYENALGTHEVQDHAVKLQEIH